MVELFYYDLNFLLITFFFLNSTIGFARACTHTHKYLELYFYPMRYSDYSHRERISTCVNVSHFKVKDAFGESVSRIVRKVLKHS